MDRTRLVWVALVAVLSGWTGWLLLGWDAPFIDYPQHVWNLAILRDPAHWADRFVVRLDPLGSNTPWFLLDRWLAPWLSPSQSMGLGYTLAIAGLPLATAWWARELGKDPWLALLLCWWVAWSGMIYWGFLHYTLAVCVGVALMAADRRHQREGRGVWGLALGWTLLFALHSIAWAWVAVLVPVQRLVFDRWGPERSPPSRWAAGFAAGVPSGLLALRWVVRTVGHQGQLGTLGSLDQGLGLKYTGFWLTLRSVVTEINASIRWTWLDDVVGGLLLILGVVGAAWSWRVQPRQRVPTGAALAVGLLSLAAVLTLPDQMKGQYFLSTRLVAFVPAAAAVLAAPRLEPPSRRWATGLAAVVALAVQLTQHRTVMRWADETAPAHQLLELVPEDQVVAIWPAPERSEVVLGQIYSHLPALYAARRGGTASFSFAIFEPNPVIYRERSLEGRTLPDEEFRPWCAAFRGGAKNLDYVLVRGREPTMHCGAVPLYREHLRERARAGVWTLYEVRSPLPAVRTRCRCPDYGG